MNDSDLMPAMPERTGRSQRQAWMAEGSGGEGSEVARVWSGERMGRSLCGVGWASVGRVRRDGRAGASHIRPIFGLDIWGA